MSATGTLAVVVTTSAICFLPGLAAGQPSPPASTGSPSSTHRVTWTAIGGGIGFGAGLVTGLSLFDDAINSDRKVWTTAVATAIGGAVAGNLLSRHSRRVGNGDPDALWNGMALGAATGAAVGLWYVPKAHCKSDINPECPRLLRIGVGIPAIAGGAALGALVDRLIGRTPPASHARSIRRSLVVPIVAPGVVGVAFAKSF